MKHRQMFHETKMLLFRTLSTIGVFALSLGLLSDQAKASPYAIVDIVGGNETYKGEFPYQVSIQERILGVFVHFCGGVIISPDYVITAAQCIFGGDYTYPHLLRVVAGEYDLYEHDGDEQVANVYYIIQHPFFDDVTLENDIAIVRLEKPLKFNEFVSALKLPEQGQDFTNEMCVVSGWGSTQEGGGLSPILRAVELPVISDEHCREFYVLDEIIYSMVCAGNDEGHKGTCKGDSGGPLACDSYLTGIVSWAYGCARPHLPSVFTEVSNYGDWIRSHM